MKALVKPLTALVLLTGMGLAYTAEAALYQRLGGLAVYDDDLNITWLADANANGAMTWQAAKDWAAGLNIGGYTGWRLPTADPTCGDRSLYCTNSELGHLYYTEGGWGLTGSHDITSSAYLAKFFTNMQNTFYWSGTEYAPSPNFAWTFRTSMGIQEHIGKGFSIRAWAVRSGDVGAGSSVPEPGIIGLMGIGALAWAGTRQKRRG